MGTTLDHGIYLPDEGERNCYDGLAGNWVALDNHLGSTDIHVTINDKQAWNGHVADTTIHVTLADKQAWNNHVADTVKHVTAEDKQAWNGKADNSALTAHTGDTTIHVTAEDKEAWNGKADALALTAHTGDTTIHVTAEDKEAWNGKADASALTAHTGDTTIHVTAEDKQAWNGHVADTVKHVTAADKAKWDAVTSKADDSAVVHKSGNETISGNKTFSSINGVKPGSLSLPNVANKIDISSYITDLTGAPNIYISPSNGYINLRSINADILGIIENTSGMGTISRGNNQTIAVYLPVVANSSISLYAKCTSLAQAYFIPCQGNV